MSRDIATHLADDGVATLTLSRPERRNALSIKLRNEITEQLDGWATDPAVRAVVLTGEGSTFCAGFDLDEFAQADLAPSIKDSSHRYHLAVWQFPKPLVAAVNGHAVAGGMDLCVLCDFRIASATALFGHPEIKFGAPPLFTPLQWIVGVGVARELCLTGRRFDAEDALRIGLVNTISEPSECSTTHWRWHAPSSRRPRPRSSAQSVIWSAAPARHSNRPSPSSTTRSSMSSCWARSAPGQPMTADAPVPVIAMWVPVVPSAEIIDDLRAGFPAEQLRYLEVFTGLVFAVGSNAPELRVRVN